MKRSLIHLALLACLFSGTAMAQVQVGDNANAVDPESTAVGDNATAFNNCVAVGENALAGAPGPFGDCTAIGADSEAALGSIGIGTRAKVRGNGTIGIGNDVNVPAGAVAGTVVVGHNSSGNNATVLGSNSSVTGNPASLKGVKRSRLPVREQASTITRSTGSRPVARYPPASAVPRRSQA